MSTFVAIAAVMTLLAVLVIVWPLLKSGNRRVLVSAITALVIPIAAAGLYGAWSTWNWHAPSAETHTQPDVAAMVARLEQKLSGDPGNMEGWLMLGRSYLALQRFDDAAAAYDHAIKLSGEKNPDAFLGFGEALSLSAGGEISPRAAEVFERALTLAPQDPKALLFGGFAAAARGDKPTARNRWMALKAMNPPPQIMQMLDEHLASLSGAPGARPGAAASGSEGEGNPSVSSANASGANAGVAEASVTVKLAPTFKSRVKPTTALFVFARDPNLPGPPLAVKRLSAAALGSTVKLSATDAMMPSRTIRAGETVAITARISFSGEPLPAAGDLFGELSYEVGKDGLRELLIDRVAD